MKKLTKEFLFRGLMCGGFGPLVYAIIMFILYFCKVNTNVDGLILFKGVISTYLMAFVIAGASILWQIDKLGLAIAIPTHGGLLYICYFLTYINNGWLESNLKVIGVFTLVFVLGYMLVWLIIYLVEKNLAKRLNKSLR